MNRPQHLSDEEMIGMLYGIGDEESHLAESHLRTGREANAVPKSV